MRLATIPPDLDLGFLENLTPEIMANVKAKWPTKNLFMIASNQEIANFPTLTLAERAEIQGLMNAAANRIYGTSILGVTLPSWWPYAAGGVGLLVVVLLLTRKR